MPPLFICESEFPRQVLFVNDDIMSGDINGAGNSILPRKPHLSHMGGRF